jgi:hypothetical protein
VGWPTVTDTSLWVRHHSSSVELRSDEYTVNTLRPDLAQTEPPGVLRVYLSAYVHWVDPPHRPARPPRHPGPTRGRQCVHHYGRVATSIEADALAIPETAPMSLLYYRVIINQPPHPIRAGLVIRAPGHRTYRGCPPARRL